MVNKIDLTISSSEKELLTESVLKLTSKFEELIKSFYGYFLQSDKSITKLFEHTPMERQQSMFNVAIGVIVTNIDNPDLLMHHLNQILERHRLYGV